MSLASRECLGLGGSSAVCSRGVAIFVRVDAATGVWLDARVLRAAGVAPSSSRPTMGRSSPIVHKEAP